MPHRSDPAGKPDGKINKDLVAPPIDIIKMAVQMMNGHGAPTFATKREKRLATVQLARQLWKSAA